MASAKQARFMPIIDTHIHLFDPRRRQGVPWPPKDDRIITRQLAEQKMERLDVSGDESMRWGVEAQAAEVLITQGKHPILTLSHPADGTSAIWMGVSPALMALRDSPYWRKLFFRSLVWSLGFVVQPDLDYSRRLVVTFDDWGAAEKSFSALFNWHFPTLSEQQVRERLIAPLQKHHAVAVADVVDGFVNRKTQRIESPWVQKFTDGLGMLQDYTSTAKGLKAALAAGCLEIASHGWTHMQPDLESPPGPWWTSDLTGEASAIGWVAEFEDWRRKKEIPAIVQLTRMNYARQALHQDFGQFPLSLLPGEYAWSNLMQIIPGGWRPARASAFSMSKAISFILTGTSFWIWRGSAPKWGTVTITHSKPQSGPRILMAWYS
jgi:hypothetical protein